MVLSLKGMHSLKTIKRSNANASFRAFPCRILSYEQGKHILREVLRIDMPCAIPALTPIVGISDSRPLPLSDGQVRFRWRDSAHSNKKRVMRLPVDEFLRRFLLHLLLHAAWQSTRLIHPDASTTCPTTCSSQVPTLRWNDARRRTAYSGATTGSSPAPRRQVCRVILQLPYRTDLVPWHPCPSHASSDPHGRPQRLTARSGRWAETHRRAPLPG